MWAGLILVGWSGRAAILELATQDISPAWVNVKNVKLESTPEDLIIIGGKSVKKAYSPTDEGVLPGLPGKRRKEAHVPLLEHCGHC